MKKNNFINVNAKRIFLYYMKGVKKIMQDKIYPVNQTENTRRQKLYNKGILEQEAHSFYFKDISDDNSLLLTNNPTCFVRNPCYNLDLKKLKNGEYLPEIILDLHGMNLFQVKTELGKLITICHQKNFFCASILHGHGKKILKKHIPFWLSKHPDIIAFHQAPKTFGYDAAILVFIKNDHI